MESIHAEIKDGKTVYDFEGFACDECSDTERIIRALMAKMGVESEIEESEKKKETESETECLPLPNRIKQ